MLHRRSQVGWLVAICSVVALYLLLLGRNTEVDSQPNPTIRVPPHPEFASSPAPERSENAATRTPATEEHHRLVLVLAGDGSAIQGASIWLCAKMPRMRSPSEDQRLGLTGVDGKFTIAADRLEQVHSGFLAVAKDSYLPELYTVSELPAVDPITITLERAAQLTVRCTDIHGATVPGITVLLSPLAIPSELAEAHNPEAALDGLDKVSAIHSQVTDSVGVAVFRSLAAKRYQVQIVSEFYEIADRSLFTIEVPGPVLELPLTQLLAIVIMAEDDEVLSYSMGTGAECLAASPNALSTREMQAQLNERYPGAAVILGASATAAMRCDQYAVDVLLAKGGPVRVDARFMPITPEFAPLLIPKRGPAAELQLAKVTFVVSSALETPSSFLEFAASRRFAGGRFDVKVPQTGKLRLPYGEWELTSRNSFVRGQFVPERFIISSPTQTVAIRMARHLVPCRLAAIGYRGEQIRQGALQFTAAGIHHAMMGPNFDQLTLWLPPGIAQFQFSAVGYLPATFEAAVFPATEEELQTIPVQLVVR